ncbi:hypothetical protein ACFL4A_04370 [bacterium]
MSHYTEGEIIYLVERREMYSSVGVLGDGMIEDGVIVNLGDLHNSVIRIKRQYAGTSRKGQELAKDYAEVGLDNSTQSKLRACARGSVQRIHDNLNIRFLNPQRLCI